MLIQLFQAFKNYYYAKIHGRKTIKLLPWSIMESYSKVRHYTVGQVSVVDAGWNSLKPFKLYYN